MRSAVPHHAAAVLVAFWILGSAGLTTAGEMINYFLPIPIVKPLTSNTWGPSATPRDVDNGLESTSNTNHTL